MTDPLSALADLLLPGDATWPPASRVLPRDTLERALAGASLAALADRVAPLPCPDATEAVRSFAAAEPEAFQTALGALTDAYYTAAALQPILRALAQAGPPDPDPHFDEALLAQVRARQAGRRRF